LIFRHAKESEKVFILSLYNHDRHKPYTAWDDTYPCMDIIEENLQQNNLFVLEENGTIVGSIAINNENELDNEKIFSNPKALEFGRVIINPLYRGKGYSHLLLNNIEKEIKARGYNAIHICVYTNDNIALSLYHKDGYKQLIQKTLFDDVAFVIFEKEI